jgi:hypothetical protein
MPLWLMLIVVAFLASCAAVVVIWAVRGDRKSQAGTRAERADERVAAGSIQPGWDEQAAHTDSWIWR